MGKGEPSKKSYACEHSKFCVTNPRVFSLTFGVAPITVTRGVLPESFQDRFKDYKSKFTTYSFAITEKLQVDRTTTNNSEVDDYKSWAGGIWDFLRDKYDIKRPAKGS